MVVLKSIACLCVSHLFFHCLFMYFLQLGRLFFRAKNNLLPKGLKKIPPVRALRNKHLQNCHNSSCKAIALVVNEQCLTGNLAIKALNKPRLILHLGLGLYQLCFLNLVFYVCCMKGKTRIWWFFTHACEL